MQRLPLRSAGCSITGNDLELSVLELPISHGSTTQGNYEASAFFIRVTETSQAAPDMRSESGSKFAEILFFGDVESSYTGNVAKALNTKVWKEAAERWTRGTLRAIFVSRECVLRARCQFTDVAEVYPRSNALMSDHAPSTSCLDILHHLV